MDTWTKHQIEFKGKIYGYWLDADGRLAAGGNIRSETNPNKTPYLKTDSKRYQEVLTAITATPEELR